MPTATRADDPERHLDAFIDKFETKNQALIRSARRALKKRLPAANEIVYDNYNFFVIGYSPTERPSDAILSIAAAANGVNVCFIHGASLRDPAGVLNGSGKQTRFLRLESAKTLARPEVDALVAQAVERSKAPLAAKGRGKLIIKSVSAKQRPRRPTLK